MFNQHKPLLFYYIIVWIIYLIIDAEAQVGNRCKLPVTQNLGVCKLVNLCPSAIEKYKLGIKPVICGRYFNLPIVCCEDQNDNTGYDFTHKRADTNEFVFPDSVPSNSDSGYKKRKSEQKCTEYSKLSVDIIQAIPLVANPDPIIAEVPKCEYNSIPLIVGGSPAEPGQFPHMTLLGYQNGDDNVEWNCGGTLISDLYVLTAAHCISTRMGPPSTIRLGEYDLAQNDDGTEPQDFGVAQVITHHRYKHPEKYNDIGLIRLSRRVHFNKFIRPACLWNRFKIIQNKTIATGWGHTEFAGERSDVLQKVALDIIENNECNTYYRSSRRQLPRGILPSMLCAGVLEGGKDTCQGDSGGPIQITDHDNQCLFYIIGITSFGKGCGSANSPAVYTRVSEYIQWIENIVWP